LKNQTGESKPTVLSLPVSIGMYQVNYGIPNQPGAIFLLNLNFKCQLFVRFGVVLVAETWQLSQNKEK